MPEQLTKLRPDRDLQCYFERPSAIAGMSEATATGFVLSGTWRQQFDWAVIEWNRDNTFEHPLLRNLPDGDLSGITLSWDEERVNCIPVDSTLYPTVDWPHLRVWAMAGASEQFHKVPLKRHAVPVSGSYACSSATFNLGGTLTVGDYVGLSWSDEQYNHMVSSGDTLNSVASSLAQYINTFSPTMRASATGTTITLVYTGPGATIATSTVGANGNRLGAYGFVSGSRTEIWTPAAATFSGGTSPSVWRFTLDFSNLRDVDDVAIPTTNVRKLRWTYAADLQSQAYQRSEFAVNVTNWNVSGSNTQYRVAGPGTIRIENSSRRVSYAGEWASASGNFSGGTISYTNQPGSAVSISYTAGTVHQLYLGTRYAANGTLVQVSVDGQTAQTLSLALAGEDVLARMRLGQFSAGSHTVSISHVGAADTYFYFDFLEAAIPTLDLPDPAPDAKLTLATDWDTDHSISLAAERTAWLIHKLGFRGRVNHYVGALWFYELFRSGHSYASATLTFSGVPAFSEITSVTINRVGLPASSATVLSHLNRMGDTAETIAKAFELVINNGYTGIWASAVANTLTIYSRSMGLDGNQFTVGASPTSGAFTISPAFATFSGGVEGDWRTDLTATPRINRAARDWTRSFFESLGGYGLTGTCAFSTELQHGDPSPAVGIAQRYPSGNAVLLNTPALQTNFSPISLAYWKNVYSDMAQVMAEAGATPYLQFGEVQWWYFPYDGSGLPFHDQYTKDQFLAAYGFPLRAVPHGEVSTSSYPEEAAFLSTLIGSFTSEIMTHVRTIYPSAQFEVLYPTDVNEGDFNRAINYPSHWSPANLDNLKTESFIYTYSRDLNKCRASMQFGVAKGFTREKRSHLIGISDAYSPWLKESRLAHAENVESIVFFALDQFCLIGYPAPLPRSSRRSGKMG